jgi:hypothetical protein
LGEVDVTRQLNASPGCSSTTTSTGIPTFKERKGGGFIAAGRDGWRDYALLPPEVLYVVWQERETGQGPGVAAVAPGEPAERTSSTGAATIPLQREFHRQSATERWVFAVFGKVASGALESSLAERPSLEG